MTTTEHTDDRSMIHTVVGGAGTRPCTFGNGAVPDAAPCS